MSARTLIVDDMEDVALLSSALARYRRDIRDRLTLHSGRVGHEHIAADYLEELRRIDRLRRAIAET